jgi:heavy metal sensor kinase
VAIAGATIFWVAFSRAELGIIDASLQAQERLLRATIPQYPPERFATNGLPDENPVGITISAVLLDDGGRVLDDSGTIPPVTQIDPLVGQVLRTGPVLESRMLGGTEQRVLAERVDGGAGRPATLVLMRSLVEYQDQRATVALLLGITVATLVAVASLSGYWLAGRVLRPVRVIAETAKDLSEHDLHRRIDLDLAPDELGDLTTTLNGMLARLEAAFASLRRFTADAAHELRAPLALMRTEVEVALRGDDEPTDARRVLETVIAEVHRLSRTADQLLLLARADAGVLEPLVEEVDVTDLLEETAMRWRPTLDERGVELRLAIPRHGGTLAADGGMLRRLLDNLIDNAARHTPRAGVIRLEGETEPGGWVLAVADTGPGIDPALRPRVFERFTRADSARSRDTGGAGLGLSLCAAIAELHGGVLELDDGHPGARWVLHLPQRAQAGAAPVTAPATTPRTASASTP